MVQESLQRIFHHASPTARAGTGGCATGESAPLVNVSVFRLLNLRLIVLFPFGPAAVEATPRTVEPRYSVVNFITATFTAASWTLHLIHSPASFVAPVGFILMVLSQDS